MLQGRKSVNQFILLFVEFPHLVRNFAERHGDTSGKTLTVFTDRPARIGFDIREPLAERLLLRLTGEVIPSFATALEDGATGEVYGTERGQAEEIDGWLEYTRGGGPERDVWRQTAVGVAFGYKTAVKDGTGIASPGAPLSRGTVTVGHRPDGPDRIPVGVGDDFFTPTTPDSVSDWEQRRGHLDPYVWVPLDERFTLKCSLSYVDRRLDWRDDAGWVTTVDNVAVVPGAGLQMHPRGSRTYLEAGLVAEYRHRTEVRSRGGRVTERSEDDFQDHRVYVAYEYRFDDAKVIRLIETVDLDREDWGSFSIHDHAFVQLLFEF
jgi:hypothetical protein